MSKSDPYDKSQNTIQPTIILKSKNDPIYEGTVNEDSKIEDLSGK